LTAQGEERPAAAPPAWRSAQELLGGRLGGRSMAELVTLAQQVVTHCEETLQAKDAAVPAPATAGP
jgi:hypothetical protein